VVVTGDSTAIIKIITTTTTMLNRVACQGFLQVSITNNTITIHKITENLPIIKQFVEMFSFSMSFIVDSAFGLINIPTETENKWHSNGPLGRS